MWYIFILKQLNSSFEKKIILLILPVPSEIPANWPGQYSQIGWFFSTGLQYTYTIYTYFLIFFQYLELRYNSRVVRLMASFSYIISIILYMGVVLYAPCLALHTITGIPVVALVLLGGIVATIYTVMVIFWLSIKGHP